MVLVHPRIPLGKKIRFTFKTNIPHQKDPFRHLFPDTLVYIRVFKLFLLGHTTENIWKKRFLQQKMKISVSYWLNAPCFRQFSILVPNEHNPGILFDSYLLEKTMPVQLRHHVSFHVVHGPSLLALVNRECLQWLPTIVKLSQNDCTVTRHQRAGSVAVIL